MRKICYSFVNWEGDGGSSDEVKLCCVSEALGRDVQQLGGVLEPKGREGGRGIE